MVARPLDFLILAARTEAQTVHEHDHERDRAAVVGVIANPMSGRDVRRLAARAPQQTPESKRNQIQRAVIGAVAGGAGRILMARDCFRISDGAAETLHVDADIEFVDIKIETKPSDTMHAVAAMREAGVRVLLVLGGDGTNRLVAQTWRDAPIIPISTGTNNVFPDRLEATAAGSAAGILASGRIDLGEVATAAKVVEAEFEDGHRELALIDCALLADDHPGSLLPFRPAQLRHLVLARAEPDAVGMSPIGGLFHPCTRDDAFGVDVRCTPPEEGKSTLLVPYSPGLFGNVHVDEARPVELGQPITMQGPGVIAFDGDRIRALAPEERVAVRVVRNGPRVIDIHRVLSLAASHGLFIDRHWHDQLDEGGGFECC